MSTGPYAAPSSNWALLNALCCADILGEDIDIPKFLKVKANGVYGFETFLLWLAGCRCKKKHRKLERGDWKIAKPKGSRHIRDIGQHQLHRREVAKVLD